TIVVNKSPVGSDPQLDRMTWGAAQLGIAQGVLDAVAGGTLDASRADDLVILIAVWVDPAAHDETAVKGANREATRRAIEDAVSDHRADAIRALAAGREGAANAYYGGE